MREGRHDQYVVDRGLTKAGKSRKRGVYDLLYFTPLLTCQLCGFFSTPKKVCERNDVFMCADMCGRGPGSLGSWGTPILCTGCWNKLRAIFRKYDELISLHHLVRRLVKAA